MYWKFFFFFGHIISTELKNLVGKLNVGNILYKIPQIVQSKLLNVLRKRGNPVCGNRPNVSVHISFYYSP